MQGRFLFDRGATPAEALATGALLARSVTAAGPPVVLYVADLHGRDALVLGSWQRAKDAVKRDVADAAGLELLRRTSGGPATLAGEGILYVALALRHASALLECPPAKVLNRNLRGMLSGLGGGTTTSQYLGHEWISVARQPVALVGWDRAPDGHVLIEAFVGRTRAFQPDAALSAYPKRKTPALAGKTPITLSQAWERDAPADDVARALLAGQKDVFTLEWKEGAPIAEERRQAEAAAESFVARDEHDADVWRWSKPREIEMGFVSAGATVGGDGRVSAVRLAGDFMQDRDAERVLAEKIVGHVPDEELFGDAVEATYGSGGRAIDGVESLDVVVKALVDVTS